MDQIELLVKMMTQAVVDRPDDVHVTPAPGPVATTYHVSVHPSDIGKALGKQGRIADAMRTIAKASAMRERRKVYIDVLSAQDLANAATAATPQDSQEV